MPKLFGQILFNFLSDFQFQFVPVPDWQGKKIKVQTICAIHRTQKQTSASTIYSIRNLKTLVVFFLVFGEIILVEYIVLSHVMRHSHTGWQLRSRPHTFNVHQQRHHQNVRVIYSVNENNKHFNGIRNIQLNTNFTA
jgi:hypothetical protein